MQIIHELKLNSEPKYTWQLDGKQQQQQQPTKMKITWFVRMDEHQNENENGK